MPSQILVIAPTEASPFVQADVRALSERLTVELIAFDQFRNKVDFLAHVYRRLSRNDVGAFFLWFLAPAYSLEVMALAHRFDRKVAVMTGGLDVDFVPALGLGGLRWPHNRLRQRIGLRAADLTIAMSDFSAERIRRIASPKRLEVVPMAVDTQRFTPLGPKEDLVLTVCFEVTRETSLLKGLPTFVEAARLLPDLRFVLVGRSGGDEALAQLRATAPPNVEFTERFVTDGELLELYRRAKVYVQVSAHEGFGLAAAEAMACEAVPVVTEGTALTDVVGVTGLVVPYGDTVATADAIRQAVASPQLGAAASARVQETFPSGKRTDALAGLLAPLTEPPDDGKVRVDLGCGSNKQLGYMGIDSRETRATDIVCDIRHTPLETGSVDELQASCVLEHFENPYEVLDEIVRVLRPDGVARLRVPNIGTFSAHLDTDHKFLADLKIWRQMIGGYFSDVHIKPLGTKYRDNLALAGLTYAAVRGLRFYELAQGWEFVCRGPRADPQARYVGWWMER
jgi:glycosyltransferase involved in cell wall biosynthesis